MKFAYWRITSNYSGKVGKVFVYQIVCSLGIVSQILILASVNLRELINVYWPKNHQKNHSFFDDFMRRGGVEVKHSLNWSKLQFKNLEPQKSDVKNRFKSKYPASRLPWTISYIILFWVTSIRSSKTQSEMANTGKGTLLSYLISVKCKKDLIWQ